MTEINFCSYFGQPFISINPQNGYVSTCQAMLEICDSHNLVNGKDFSGRTPIHLAAAAGQYHVLVELTAVPFANNEALDSEGRYMYILCTSVEYM